MSLENDVIDAAIEFIKKKSRDYLIYELMAHCFDKNRWTNADFDEVCNECFSLMEDMEDERLVRDDRDYIKKGTVILLGLMARVIVDNKEYNREIDDEDDRENDKQIKGLLNNIDDVEDELDGGGRRSRSRRSGGRGRDRDDDYDDDRRSRRSSRGRKSRSSRGRDRGRDDREEYYSRDRSRNSRRGRKSKDNAIDRAGTSTMQAIRARNMVEDQVNAVNKDAYEFTDPESKRETARAARRTERNVEVETVKEIKEVLENDQEYIIDNYPIDGLPFEDKTVMPAYDPKVSKLVWYVTEDNTRKCRVEAYEMDPNNHILTYSRQSSKTLTNAIEKEREQVKSILLSESVVYPTQVARKQKQASDDYNVALADFEEKMADTELSEEEKSALVAPIKPEPLAIVQGHSYDLQDKSLAGFGKAHLLRNMYHHRFLSEDKISSPRIGYYTTNELDILDILENDLERENLMKVIVPLLVGTTRGGDFIQIRKAMTSARPIITPSAFNKLDKYLTTVINNVMKYNMALSAQIDSFFDDILELNKNLKEAFGDATVECFEEYSNQIFNALRVIIPDNKNMGEASEFINRSLVMGKLSGTVLLEKTIGSFGLQPEADAVYVESKTHPELFETLLMLQDQVNRGVSKDCIMFRIIFTDGNEINVYRNFWSDGNGFTCVLN